MDNIPKKRFIPKPTGLGGRPTLPPFKRKVKKTVWLDPEFLVLLQHYQTLLAETGEKKAKSIILREAVECGLRVLAGNLLSR